MLITLTHSHSVIIIHSNKLYFFDLREFTQICYTIHRDLLMAINNVQMVTDGKGETFLLIRYLEWKRTNIDDVTKCAVTNFIRTNLLIPRNEHKRIWFMFSDV